MKETTAEEGQLTNQKRTARRGGYEYLAATLPNKKISLKVLENFIFYEVYTTVMAYASTWLHTSTVVRYLNFEASYFSQLCQKQTS